MPGRLTLTSSKQQSLAQKKQSQSVLGLEIAGFFNVYLTAVTLLLTVRAAGLATVEQPA